MKTNIFFTAPTSEKLNENFEKHFGGKVNLTKYTREQLEDMRNKLRTRVFQQEGSAGYNDLLTNETYQKDKAMLDLLNTRIKEMLGEDIKKLRNRMVELSEAKKGVRAPKYAKKASGTKSTKDYDGDGKIESPKDEVWGSRAKAAAKAGKPFSEEAVDENRVVKGRAYGGAAQKDSDYEHDEKPTSKGSSEITAADRAKTKAADKASDRAGKDWEARGYKRTVVKGKSQSGSSKDDDIDESTDKCNHTPKGKKCPVHGLKECGTMSEASKPSAGMSKKEKSAVVKKAKAGGDIGKPGKSFAKVEKAAKKSGARDPKAVAAAAMWKQQAKENFKRNVKMVNESLVRMIAEDEEGKAKAITAASDIVNDYTTWMQRVGQYQTKAIIELSDAIRADFGLQQAEAFKQAVAPALAATLDILTQQREAISNAVAVLAGEEMPPTDQMGTEPGMEEPSMEPAAPDEMNAGDEFAASDAAAGGPEASGREMRESKFVRKLAESHSIISRLAR